MGAPKGNQFWLARSTHGRGKKFTPESLWDACLEYFQWVEDHPLREEKIFHNSGEITRTDVCKMRAMTIGSACIFLDICENTWASYREHNDFVQVVMRAERIIKSQKFTGAAADLLNPNIIARDLGLTDKKELMGEGGGPIKTANQFVWVPVSSSDEPN